MEGIKLIDAEDVVVKKKTSKVEIKKISKSPIKIIADDGQKSVPKDICNDDVARSDTINILKPDVVKVSKHDVVDDTKPDMVSTTDIGDRTTRTIKLKQDIYYGPKNANKNKFVRMYKKLKLVWRTESIDGMMVDGWLNSDKSQYIIKLLEIDGFKRFKFRGCDDIYDYFVSLGGVKFDYNGEDSPGSNCRNDIVGNVESVKGGNGDIVNIGDKYDDKHDDYKFIGADLWSRYRTGQLLKNVPDNWGVIWK